MTSELQREIEKYLSKKNPYFSKFSTELQSYLEITYPGLPTIRARWYMLQNNLSEFPKCEFNTCNEFCTWNEREKRFNYGCCSDHNKRITSLKNFGTEHPNQSKKQQAKVKKSMQEKYGVDYVTQTNKHKESVKKTVKKKYGVDTILKSKEIRKKIKQTNLERYGVEEILSNEQIREKIRLTMIDRYGVEHSLSSPQIRAKVNKTNLEKYGSIFPMRNEDLLEKRQQGIIEKYDAYSPIAKKEDPEKYFHLDKAMEAENNGETYYFIFDNEKEERPKQIEWTINRKIERKLRSYVFQPISHFARDEFIFENSLYTNDSEIRQNYGVYYEGELVAIFSGYEKVEYYEITRFVVKIGVEFKTNIITNFIKYINKTKPIIISFDRRFTPFNQPFLKDAGFEFVGGTEPRRHSEKIWDCGKLVYKKG